jgi:CRP/FNR family transcriptional regulator
MNDRTTAQRDPSPNATVSGAGVRRAADARPNALAHGRPRGTAELQHPEAACRHCAMFALCLPAHMGEADLNLLERVVKRRRLLRRGELLFRQGDRFHAVYAVKSGAIKSFLPVEGKTPLVIAFHLPGDLLALDAVGTGFYQYGARALETTSLCELPFDQLEALGSVVTSVQQQLVRLMSGQIRRDMLLHRLHCRTSAAGRLAAFLVNLSAHFARRGFAAAEFRLPMSRSDIGSYLGLTKETVSRLCTDFQQRGLVSFARKHVRIRDLFELERLAELPAAADR